MSDKDREPFIAYLSSPDPDEDTPATEGELYDEGEFGQGTFATPSVATLTREERDALIDLEIMELSSMYAAIRTKIKSGNLAAIETGLKIRQLRANLLGLYQSASGRWNAMMDFNKLSDDQVRRLAQGEDVVKVLTSPD